MTSYHLLRCLMMLLIIASTILGINVSGSAGSTSTDFLDLPRGDNNHRKLLADGGCTKEDIKVEQGMNSTSGRPQYRVQIINTCASQCGPSDIHLHCGQFDFERIRNPDPETFKRLSDDDCLVNGGNPLRSGESVNFTYLNSFMYPLVFMSAKFC